MSMTPAEQALAEALVEVGSAEVRERMAMRYGLVLEEWGAVAQMVMRVVLQDLGATPAHLDAVREEQERD